MSEYHFDDFDPGDFEDMRDRVEERYWRDHCPACDCSPCMGAECEAWIANQTQLDAIDRV